MTNNLGPDPTATIAFTTGLHDAAAAGHYAGDLAGARAVPRLGWLIKFRRLLGLFAFFYATLHMLTWVGAVRGLRPDTMAADIVKRRFITVGMAAWLLLLPLAATSTTWAIRKLGGKNWNRLHMLVYAGRNLRSDSLLVAGEDRRADAARPSRSWSWYCWSSAPSSRWHQRRKARAVAA